uniref:Defensin-like protein 88 n=1 Tax=Cicer arietinum TaxID=3827 RepID=A0A3Q7YFR2_CICAR|nr:putative defensin-like protein 88 [Cicer arietinum]
MAFRNHHFYVFCILCVGLSLLSGSIAFDFPIPPGKVCIKNKCSNDSHCNQECKQKGFIKGGNCYSFTEVDYRCCCVKK